LRRQTQNRGHKPAGSSREQRLDPFALPLQFPVADRTADDHVRLVELSRDRVRLHRAICGIKMVVQVPVETYLGVVIRIEPPDADTAGAVMIMLEHHDRDLSVPLHRASDGDGVVADWQAWARVLRLPMLVAEPDGQLREPFERLGPIRLGAPVARRRRQTAVRRRRPTRSLRRKTGRSSAEPVVLRGAREIIAPN
jgi:uncharacterized protein DUF6101